MMKDYSNHNRGDLCIVTDKKLFEEPTLLKCIPYSEYETRNPESEAGLYVSFKGIKPKDTLRKPTGLYKVEHVKGSKRGNNVFCATGDKGTNMSLYVINEHALEEKRLPENVVPFIKQADCSKRMYSMLNHASNKKNKITIDGEEAILVEGRSLKKTVKGIKEGAVAYVTTSRIIRQYGNSLKEEKFHPKKLTEVPASKFYTTGGAVFKLLIGTQTGFGTETRAYFIFKRSDITLFTDKKEEKESMKPTILTIKPEECIYSHVDDKQESVFLQRKGSKFKERMLEGDPNLSTVYVVFYESYGMYIKAGDVYSVHGDSVNGFFIKTPEGSITSILNEATGRTIDSFELFVEIHSPKSVLAWESTTCKINGGTYTDSIAGVYINDVRYTVVPSIYSLPKTYESHIYVVPATTVEIQCSDNGKTQAYPFIKGSPVLFTTFDVTDKRETIHLVLSQLKQVGGYVILAPSERVAVAVMLAPEDDSNSVITANRITPDVDDTKIDICYTSSTDNMCEPDTPKKSEEKRFLNNKTNRNKTTLNFKNPDRITKIYIILLAEAIKQKIPTHDLHAYKYLNLTDDEVNKLYEQALIDNPVSL